jgi:hypothetical protein
MDKADRWPEDRRFTLRSTLRSALDGLEPPFTVRRRLE